ncbi:MAG: metallophosphoesterase [Ignavibacterium sp.]|nr:metallophosphoesterase [Ignavibacterium sp.]MDW8376088.1 metallophosphoesterase [Ignavibacteriales bacterium]
MKRIKRLFLSLIILLIAFQIAAYSQNQNDEEIFFVFLTDIHVQPERNGVEGFDLAIQKVNELNPDFILTGGDLLFDVLAVGYERADSLFNIYLNMIKKFKSPVYNTIGNHDIFGWYEKSKVPRDHLEFGKKMYQNRIGKTYYTFNFKGVKFFVLDSIEEVPEKGKYYGYINQEQIDWIKDELSKTDTNTIIIISTHIPMITTLSQIRGGSMVANERGLVIENAKEVLDLFSKHKLKLVLQGHLHYYEDLNVQNKVRFITGGAVSGRWWLGDNYGLEEGFVLIRIKNGKIEANYLDYGWQVK